MKYINHFGTQTTHYLKFRPSYPDSLFDYLAKLTHENKLAWDCGTGNGQAAIALAQRFTKVIATDINQAQLEVAPKKDNISYYNWPAENTKLLAHTTDLITVAQALHWFNLEKFYQEVRRVSKPGGIIAAWTYPLGNVSPDVDKIINKLYDEILGDKYWPKERKYIDANYKTIPFPFQKIKTPHFTIEKNMNFDELIGYLQTWSAVKEYHHKNNQNPVELVHDELRVAWGNPNDSKIMKWPLHLLVGIVT